MDVLQSRPPNAAGILSFAEYAHAQGEQPQSLLFFFAKLSSHHPYSPLDKVLLKFLKTYEVLQETNSTAILLGWQKFLLGFTSIAIHR